MSTLVTDVSNEPNAFIRSVKKLESSSLFPWRWLQ